MTPTRSTSTRSSRRSGTTDEHAAAGLKEKLDELVRQMIDGGIRFPDAKREFEKRFLAMVMEREQGNLSRAAKALHIHRNTLSKKLGELKLGGRR